MNPFFDRPLSPEEADKLPTVEEINAKSVTQKILCGLWEEEECEVVYGYCTEYRDNHTCTHYDIVKVKTQVYWKTGVRWFETTAYNFHEVLVAINEGGFNSTGVCIPCFRQQMAKVATRGSNEQV